MAQAEVLILEREALEPAADRLDLVFAPGVLRDSFATPSASQSERLRASARQLVVVRVQRRSAVAAPMQAVRTTERRLIGGKIISRRLAAEVLRRYAAAITRSGSRLRSSMNDPHVHPQTDLRLRPVSRGSGSKWSNACSPGATRLR